jgi:FeS assembly protein IscX
MLWTDIYEIVDELIEKHSEIDPEKILFVDLRKIVIDLDGFTDDPDRSNEKILEAIQATWIEIRD